MQAKLVGEEKARAELELRRQERKEARSKRVGEARLLVHAVDQTPLERIMNFAIEKEEEQEEDEEMIKFMAKDEIKAAVGVEIQLFKNEVQIKWQQKHRNKSLLWWRRRQLKYVVGPYGAPVSGDSCD